MILNNIWSWLAGFFINHWVGILVGLIIIGVLIRVAIFASNPLVALTNMVKWLKTSWREALIVLLILSTVGYGIKQHLLIKQQETIIARKDEQLKIAETNISNLESSIKQANFMIEKFDDFAASVKNQYAVLTASVNISNKTLAEQLRLITEEKKPQTCEEAIQYLIQANKDYPK
jgi:hypothetical protein